MSRATSSRSPSPERDGDVGALAGSDRLATDLIAAGAPIRVRVVVDPAEVEAIYRLRYRCVVEQGWARPEDLPDGREHDAFDDDAVHLGAWDGDRLVGTGRLVLPEPGRRLPTEDVFDVDIDPVGEVVDGSRLLLDPAYRGDSRHRAMGALFGLGWLETRRRGYHRHAAAATESMVALIRQLGFEVSVLGPSHDYWGQQRFPVRIVATAATARAFAQREADVALEGSPR